MPTPSIGLNGNTATGGHWSGTPAEKGAATEVWVGLRTDGQPGVGTAEDPFDGSTQPKFDALMQGFGSYTTIHLLPGTFQTQGLALRNYDDFPPAPTSPGWTVQEGWKIRGAGMRVTTLQMVGVTSSTYDEYNYRVVTSLTKSQTDYVEVSDLTIDVNAPAFIGVLAGRPASAIRLNGAYCRISRVESINAYGDGLECFDISIWGPDGVGTPGAIIPGNIIENCLSRSPAAGSTYITAIMVSDGFSSDGTLTQYNRGAIIRGNTVLDNPFVAYEANVSEVLLIGNYSQGPGGGFGQDTLSTWGNKFIGNTFHVIGSIASAVNFGPGGSYIQSDYLFEGNTILLEGDDLIGLQFGSDGGGPGYVDQLRIANNHFVSISGTSQTAIKALNAQATNIWIEGNVSTLSNDLSAASASVKVGNNFFGGAYVPDAGVPLLNAANVFTQPQTINGAYSGLGLTSAGAFPASYVVGSAPDTVTGGRFYIYNATIGRTDLTMNDGRVVLMGGYDDGTNALQVNGPAAMSEISLNGVKILTGSGTPSVAAPVGSLYLRTDGSAGSALYVKESGTGTTGWAAK